MQILVVGAGVAGLTAALCLARDGNEVTVFEREPALAGEGYMIDFFGPGYDVAERLGLLTDLERIHYPIDALVFLDEAGRRRASLAYPQLRRTLFRGRHFNFLRGDLVDTLRAQLSDRVDLRFGTTTEVLFSDGPRVVAESSTGERLSFDLVIGADGARSRVRSLAFPGHTHEIRLNAHTASYVIGGVPPGLEAGSFSSTSTAGATVAAYPIRGDRTAAFFVYRHAAPIADRSAVACRRELEAECGDAGALARELLDAFPERSRPYFDDVFQIELDRWSSGQVVLLGDACGCVSLLAGQGASMAMAGAFIFAQELRRGGDPTMAAARYEARLRPEVEKRQRNGRRGAAWFLPKTRFRARLRDELTGIFVSGAPARLIGRLMGGSAISLD